jgi:hypothetical protein
MVNKKGYIQTLEAIVAILIIYITVLSLMSQYRSKTQAGVPLDIKLTQDALLKEIESSNIYRNCALSNNTLCIDDLINKSIGNKYMYKVALCTVSSCAVPITPNREVYVRSIIVSSNITNYTTTSVNIYLWKKIS